MELIVKMRIGWKPYMTAIISGENRMCVDEPGKTVNGIDPQTEVNAEAELHTAMAVWREIGKLFEKMVKTTPNSPAGPDKGC